MVCWYFFLSNFITINLKRSEKKCFSIKIVGDGFRGDMLLSKDQLEELFAPARNGLISTKYRWPNKTVPYLLSTNHTQQHREYIERILKTIESVSCVKFIRRTNETDYVEITVSRTIAIVLCVFNLEINFNLLTIGRQTMMAVVQRWDSIAASKHWIWKMMMSVSDVSGKWLFYMNFCMVNLIFANGIKIGMVESFCYLLRSSRLSSYAKCIQSRWLCHSSLGKYSTGSRRPIYEVLELRRDILQHQLRLFECDALWCLLFLEKWQTNTCAQSEYSIQLQVFHSSLELESDALTNLLFYKDQKYLNVIGNAISLSDKDIQRLNAMYECNNAPTAEWTSNARSDQSKRNSPAFRVRAFCLLANCNSRWKKNLENRRDLCTVEIVIMF